MHEKTIRVRRAGALAGAMIKAAPQSFRREISAWLAHPPYDGIPWLAWLYVVMASIWAGGGPFNGDLIWFDDRVRLVQIFNWLNGAGWYDRTIRRVNLPEGFHTIWSRAVDLPVAGIIAALQGRLGQMHAAMVAATLVPLLETLLLFYAAAYCARPLLGKNNAKLVTLFVLFGSCINPESFTLAGFQVGMIGHHAWYVLLVLMLFGSLARLVLQATTRSAVIAGLSIGILLMVGIEGFPLMAGSFGLMAALAGWQNRPRLAYDAFRVTAFGAALGLLLLPVNQSPDQLLSISFAEPSLLGPILIGAASLFFAAQFALLRRLRRNRAASTVLTVLLAAVIGGVLLHIFPQFLDGGAAALSPEERKLAAAEHEEAMTLYHIAQNSLDYLRMIVPPLLAAGFALYQLRHAAHRKQRAVTLFYLGLLLVAFTMASLYSRFYHYLGLATAPWLVLLWLAINRHFARDEYRALKCFTAYAAIGPLWLWLVSAANYDLPLTSGVLLFPAKVQTEPQRCEAKDFLDYIDLHYDADKTIMAPMYMSDRFLLHTKLKVFFLANFPSQNKFIEAKNFYDTLSEDTARDIIARHHIDLVAVCSKAYIISTQSMVTKLMLKNHMKFGQRLVTGNAPAWLKPVQAASTPAWLLFETDPAIFTQR